MSGYYKNETNNASKKFFMIDYQITNQILTLSDAVVSPRSTVLLEAIIKGKPVLVILSERLTKKNIYNPNNIHFKNFCEMKLINVCTEDDFNEKCKILEYQIGNQEISKELMKNSGHFCQLSGLTYSERLQELADNIIFNQRNLSGN